MCVRVRVSVSVCLFVFTCINICDLHVCMNTYT